VAALLAGLVVFVLQFPWSGGLDSTSPTCFGMFGLWTVPQPTAAAGALTALLVWFVLVVAPN